MRLAQRSVTCACRTPKPVEITEETFEGLFVDTPASTAYAITCDRCGGMIQPWRAR